VDRRSFIGGSCAVVSAASLEALASTKAKYKAYARATLVDEGGQPLKAASLKPRSNYVFHYPFEATPVFLLDLGKPALPQALSTKERVAYSWPGGVGKTKSIVAFSAICAHHLVYPTKDVSFISFRSKRAARGVQDDLIHCCADHSQYDPAKGAEVLSGPATQPLAAVLLEHDAKTDTLVAYGTLGGELFEDFFRKYEAKLSLDVGVSAKNAVAQRATVRPLEKFCRNAIQC
jgi:Rieske Fe-S protein